jgi:hypothetical protein
VYTNTEQQSPPISPTFSIVTENIQNALNVLTSEKHVILDKTLFKNNFYANHNSTKQIWFSNTFSNREVRYKNNFIISLSSIKYKFYSLIGSNYIMYLNITLHILLHPSNMHAWSHQDPKPLYGTLPTDQQLSLNIHP